MKLKFLLFYCFQINLDAWDKILTMLYKSLLRCVPVVNEILLNFLQGEVIKSSHMHTKELHLIYYPAPSMNLRCLNTGMQN